MKDYDELLNTILDEETLQQAELYFQKYWLNKDEHIEKWLPIEFSIFNDKAKHLPDMMFNKDFELFPLVGGDIFLIEQDFSMLRHCMIQAGDDEFVIVQNEKVIVEVYSGENRYIVEPFVKFKYPVNISWSEMMSGGIVGCEHFNNGCKDYFVFGNSGNWGRYVANSWVQPNNLTGLNPLIIMGFKKEYSEIFKNSFEEIRLLEPEITPVVLFSEWLPDSYKQQP
jgi:hypothetical protein